MIIQQIGLTNVDGNMCSLFVVHFIIKLHRQTFRRSTANQAKQTDSCMGETGMGILKCLQAKLHKRQNFRTCLPLKFINFKDYFGWADIWTKSQIARLFTHFHLNFLRVSGDIPPLFVKCCLRTAEQFQKFGWDFCEYLRISN